MSLLTKHVTCSSSHSCSPRGTRACLPVPTGSAVAVSYVMRSIPLVSLISHSYKTSVGQLPRPLVWATKPPLVAQPPKLTLLSLARPLLIDWEQSLDLSCVKNWDRTGVSASTLCSSVLCLSLPLPHWPLVEAVHSTCTPRRCHQHFLRQWPQNLREGAFLCPHLLSVVFCHWECGRLSINSQVNERIRLGKPPLFVKVKWLAASWPWLTSGVKLNGCRDVKQTFLCYKLTVNSRILKLFWAKAEFWN